MESLLEKIGTCNNNPGKSSVTKINKHTASGCSLFTDCSFDVTKNKHDYYRDKDCMKNFCKDLKEHATKIISKKNQKYHSQLKKINHIASKKFVIYSKNNSELMTVIKKHCKVRDHCHYIGFYRGPAHNVCNLRYKTPKEISVVFHSLFKYNYHFIIKELAEEFKGQFEYLGENTEKYIFFSINK